jgi:hypothetical protein
LLEAFEKPLERWDGAWIELKAEDWKELHATLEAPGLTLPELFSQGAKAEISPRAYLAFINAVRDAVDALPEELPS